MNVFCSYLCTCAYIFINTKIHFVFLLSLVLQSSYMSNQSPTLVKVKKIVLA